MTRLKWAGLILLAVAIMGAAGYFGFRSSKPQTSGLPELAPPTTPVARGDVHQMVSAPGQMVETRRQTLRMGVEGALAEVLAAPGDAVKAGQVLARLGNREDFEAKVSTAKLDWLQAQQDLEDVQANAPKETADAQLALIEAEKKYTEAKANVEALKYPRASQERLDWVYSEYMQALEDVAVAQNNYDNVVNLLDYDPRRIDALRGLTEAQIRRDNKQATYNWLNGKPTEADVAKAEALFRQAEGELAVAKRAWERVQDGVDSTKLELARAKAADLEAKYQKARADLEQMELKAPFDGVVVEVKARPGDVVTPATAILDVTDPRALEAQVTVVEEDWPLIKTGQTAQLYMDASTSADLTGTVARVVPARAGGDRPVYPVYITPKALPEGVAPGMTVDAAIVIDARENVLTLPKAVVRIRGDGTAEVTVWRNGLREKRQVKVGLVGDETVEILEGLEEGELVVAQ